MSHGRKPRQARWSASTPLMLATHYAAKHDAEELQHIMQPIKDAFTAIRTGVASELHWSHLYSSVAVAKAIERQGVVRGLHEHQQAALAALQAIYSRAMDVSGHVGTWTATPLYFQELEALQTHVELYEFQVGNLSRGEFRSAIKTATGQVSSQHGITVLANPCPPRQGVQTALELAA